MAQPRRTTITIDSNKFNAYSSSVVLLSNKSSGNMPEMGSLTTSIRVWVDFHDDANMPFSTMQSLFDLANVVTRDKIKDIKIEFWKDDSQQDALCAYQFKGWISRFETTSVPSDAIAGGTPATNHMLVLDLEPALNTDNYKDLKMTN